MPVPQVEAPVKAVSAVTEADKKNRSLEWPVNGLWANQYQNGLFSSATTWICSEFRTVPPAAKPCDASRIQALMAKNPDETSPGTVVCQ